MLKALARRRRPEGREPKAPGRRAGWLGRASLLLPLPILAIFVVFGLQLRDRLEVAASPDSCQGWATNQAVFLLDLQKPYTPAQAALPGRLLRQVAFEMPADTELGVFALAEYAEAPRMLLGKLCKPAAGEGMATGDGDGGGLEADPCDTMRPGLLPSLRDGTQRFCAQRDDLVSRIDTLVGQPRNADVGNAYLVEALEDTAWDFQQRAGPKSLYVLSDMMQHAPWYSHLDTAWNAWDFETFAERRSGRTGAGEPAPAVAGIDVTVFYLARKGVTGSAQPRLAHQRFWQAYFNGAQLTFDEQPTVLAYAGEPLMNVASEVELVARERERLRYERADLERVRADLQRDREQLAQARRRIESVQRQGRQRELELQRAQELLEERQAELAVERERLSELLAAPAEANE